MIRSGLLAACPGLGHAHSTRADGPVGALGVPGAAAGRAALVRAVGADPEALCVPHQVHGARVGVAARPGAVFSETDALVTRTRGLPLLVQGADCPLVALFDATARVAAVCHSGWRGTVARIATATLDAMRGLGADAGRVTAAVFPGIGPCCFEVGPDVAGEFASAFGADAAAWLPPARAQGKRMLDLRAAIAATLAAEGVAAERIDVVPGCTACGGDLYSHRASRGAPERHGLCLVVG